MSVDSMLRHEVEKNQELREKLLLVGFALQKAKASVDDLEETLQQWPEGQHPDILTTAFAHIADVRRELNKVSGCADENGERRSEANARVNYEIIPLSDLPKTA